MLGILTRTVVKYDAEDAEHGPVRVVVTSNRLTGRRVRRVCERHETDP